MAVLTLAGCQGSSHSATGTSTTLSPASSTTSISVPGGSGTTSSSVAIQASGPRTVLSPIGLNVRSQPSKTASVAGTAGQGAVFTVLGHTDQGGGFYQVKGATTTGFITDNPALSADGKFTPYTSNQHNFSALYPQGWAPTEAPPASVVFHPPAGAGSIVVTNGTSTARLGHGRTGYREDSSSVVVVCGVTGDLVTLIQSSPSASTPAPPAGGAVAERYLIQLRLTLDAQHALGIDANIPDLTMLATVKNVVYSISFPFPQCEQGATPSDTSSTAPASTVP